MDKKYKWRILYKPPIEQLDDDNVDTWRKVFYLNIYDCPTKLDLAVKIAELKKIYKMKDEYVILQDLEGNE